MGGEDEKAFFIKGSGPGTSWRAGANPARGPPKKQNPRGGGGNQGFIRGMRGGGSSQRKWGLPTGVEQKHREPFDKFFPGRKADPQKVAQKGPEGVPLPNQNGWVGIKGETKMGLGAGLGGFVATVLLSYLIFEGIQGPGGPSFYLNRAAVLV